MPDIHFTGFDVKRVRNAKKTGEEFFEYLTAWTIAGTSFIGVRKLSLRLAGGRGGNLLIREAAALGGSLASVGVASLVAWNKNRIDDLKMSKSLVDRELSRTIRRLQEATASGAVARADLQNLIERAHKSEHDLGELTSLATSLVASMGADEPDTEEISELVEKIRLLLDGPPQATEKAEPSTQDAAAGDVEPDTTEG